MIVLAVDTETALIQRGLLAPPITCVSYAVEDAEGQVVSGLMHHTDAKEEVTAWLENPDVLLTGHNLAYDLAVIAAEWPDLLPLIFKAYEDDRCTDTLLRQKLLDLAEGRLGGFRTDKGVWIKLQYSLEAIANRLCGIKLEKDEFRLKYGELRDVPLDQWQPGARKYAIDDAAATLACYKAQEVRNKERGGGAWLEDQYRQTRANWCAHLTACWGIKTDPSRVKKLIEETEAAYQELAGELQQEPWALVRKDGSRNITRVRERLVEVMGSEDKCRKTPKGAISTDDDACRSSGDCVLEGYADLTKLGAVRNKDIPMLALGRWIPIQPRWDTLLETGRTSTSGPSLQNLRKLVGIRECFTARPGMVFADADYSIMELRCLAEVCYSCFGYSKLGEALNAGKDPHLMIASDLLGIDYEEAKQHKKDKYVDDKRQLGKVANFGLAGGLGAETLTFYAKHNYKVILTIDEAKALKEVYFNRWPEVREYMKLVSDSLRGDYNGEGVSVTSLYSNRVRGKCRYTQSANNMFQALASDAMKAAWFLIAKSCYVDRSSVLYGSRVVVTVHDQYICEVKEETGHEAAYELARLMVEGAKPWLPHCPAVVDEPVLSRVWSKQAKPTFDASGRLIPWVE